MTAAPDSTFTTPEQRIADLQRQLVECSAELDKAQRYLNETMTERDEALAREAATAEVLGVINSSPGDLAPVFDAMLDKATRLCEADFGILLTYAEDHYRAAAFHNVPSAYVSALQEPIRPSAKMALRRIACGDPVAQIEDIAADNKELSSDPTVRGALELAGFRTVLAVALRKDGALLGAITIYRQEARLFSDKQIALLQNFAAQAVIAMENARLLTETREALEHQTATAEVLQVINSSPGNLLPVFDELLDKATGLCEAVYGILCTYDGERFHPNAIRSDSQFAEWLRERSPILPRPGSPFDRIVRGERFVGIADTEIDVIYHASPGFRELAEIAGIRSHLVVGLRKDATLIGARAIYRKEVDPFSDKQIALLQNFAAQAVIAMENARLLAETREALEQQTATAELLQVINSSPGDLAPVFDAILEKHTASAAPTTEACFFRTARFSAQSRAVGCRKR